MTRQIRRAFTAIQRAMAVGAAAVLCSVAPLMAQTISPRENASSWGTARGWTVYVMSDGRGVNSCRAVRGHGYGDQIMIDYGLVGLDAWWQIYVPANRTARDDDGVGIRGAGIYIDNRLASDSQSGFGSPGADGSSTTHAGIAMTEELMARVRNGNSLGVFINDETPRTYSLTGSAAAMLMVDDCVRRNGIMTGGPVSTSAPVASQPAPPMDVVTGETVWTVRFPYGHYRRTSGLTWVEEGNNGGGFFFQQYDAARDGVFLNDPSRNVQIWIDLTGRTILYTENFGNWSRLYEIECASTDPRGSC